MRWLQYVDNLVIIMVFCLCSPIQAPVDTSFAGALRWINVSSSSSGVLMSRSLSDSNYTESYKGVSFSGLLPMVRK